MRMHLKHRLNTVVGIFSAICLILTIVTDSFSLKSYAISFDNTSCGISEGNNIENQNYDVHANVVGSYLFAFPNGRLMRIQSEKNGAFDVEYYDSSYNLTGYKHMSAGLPIFGGAYVADDGYNYLLSGQNRQDVGRLSALLADLRTCHQRPRRDYRRGDGQSV